MLLRKRNQKYIEDVGDICVEIENQDLETINGGKDDKISIFTCLKVCSYVPTVTCECMCTLTKPKK